MKKEASKLMTEEKFWAIIESSHRGRDFEFEWEEDDEDSIRKVCPRTFDKWWGNDVF